MNAKSSAGQPRAGAIELWGFDDDRGASVMTMMHHGRQGGGWSRRRAIPMAEVAEALDQPSGALIWLLPVFAVSIGMLIGALLIL